MSNRKEKDRHINDIESAAGSVSKFFKWCNLNNPSQAAFQYKKTSYINPLIQKLLELYKMFKV